MTKNAQHHEIIKIPPKTKHSKTEHTTHSPPTKCTTATPPHYIHAIYPKTPSATIKSVIYNTQASHSTPAQKRHRPTKTPTPTPTQHNGRVPGVGRGHHAESPLVAELWPIRTDHRLLY